MATIFGWFVNTVIVADPTLDQADHDSAALTGLEGTTVDSTMYQGDVDVDTHGNYLMIDADTDDATWGSPSLGNDNVGAEVTVGGATRIIDEVISYSSAGGGDTNIATYDGVDYDADSAAYVLLFTDGTYMVVLDTTILEDIQTAVGGDLDPDLLSVTLGQNELANTSNDRFGIGVDLFSPTGVMQAPDYIVEGTSGDDVIDTNYTGDPDGDMVDANDNIAGNDDDSISAGAGDDTVLGGAGDDTILGEAGEDSIDGGEGDDSIDGGDDADTINVTGAFGDDTVAGGEGGNDDDTLQAAGITGNSVLDFTANGTGTDNESGTLTVEGAPAPAGFHYVTIFEPNGTIGNAGVYPSGDIDFNDGTFHQILVEDDDGVLSDSQGVGNGAGGDVDLTQTFAEDLDGIATTGTGIGAPGLADYTDANGNSFTAGFITSYDTGSGAASIPYQNYLVISDADGAIPVGTATFSGTRSGIGDFDYDDFSAPTDTVTFTEIESVDLGSGDDVVIGSSTADTFTTGAGADSIDAGAGDDYYDIGYLDGDVDVVTFSNGDGNDLVGDFEVPTIDGNGDYVGHDQLDVSGMMDADGNPVNVDDVVVSMDGGGNAVITFPNGESITFKGVTPAELSTDEALVAIGIPAGPNYIVEGTAGADVIDAFYTLDPEGDLVDAGDNATGTDDDSILAAGGNDTVYSGNGDDTVDGGAGDDAIYSGVGDDSILGGTGDDFISTGDGADTIYGNAGGDDVNAGAGNDVVFGGDDGDNISGDDGNDSLVGEAGGDSIWGGDGNDTIEGGAGNDALYGQLGSDSILGGAGDDFINATATDNATAGDYVSGGDDQDNIIADSNDTIDGGEGGVDNDTLQVNNVDFITFLTTNTENGTVTFNDGSTATFTNIETVIADGVVIAPPNFIVEGTTGDDLIDVAYTSDPEGDMVDANDNVAGNNDDSILAGEGDDTVYAGAGDDTVRGGIGQDTIIGGAGDDSIYGNEDGDSIEGGAGSDTIYGEEGDDIVSGGAGDDTVEGNEGADTIYGGEGDDWLRGSYGNDELYGGTGDDYVWGGFGDDTIHVENDFGNDTISGEGVAETNGDTLNLSAVTDDLTVDLTDANPENGSFTDGVSTATFEEIENIVLGSGTDTVVLADGSGGDIVDGFEAPTVNGDGSFTGNDQLDVSGMTSDAGTTPVTVADVVVTDDGNGNAVITFPGGENITLIGIDPVDAADPSYLVSIGIPSDGIVSGTTGDDVINGAYTDDPDGDMIDGNDAHLPGQTGDDDIVYAGAGDDTVIANDGDDEIHGGAGNDILLGADGADEVYGDEGDDTIMVAEGDTAYGDGGDDLFHIQDYNEAGTDDITIVGGEGDETTGDTLLFHGLTTFADVTYTNTDPGVGGGMSGTAILSDGSIVTFSEIETVIICFTAGTKIATPQGARKIEDLRPGDMVVTRDNGLQPVRWSGCRTVPALGALAPIRFSAGVLGNDVDLFVSPQHRMLIQGAQASLMFGESEVLASAKHLVNGTTVRHAPGGDVTYVHVLFDQHEVIYAEGAASESFFPGDTGLDSVEDAAREELFTLFPELRSSIGNYGETARMCLRAHESRLLRLG